MEGVAGPFNQATGKWEFRENKRAHGTFCTPCLRVGPICFGGQGRNRTADASLFRAALSELRLTDSWRLTANSRLPRTPVFVTTAFNRNLALAILIDSERSTADSQGRR